MGFNNPNVIRFEYYMTFQVIVINRVIGNASTFV
jgi:hypothetical protein